MCEYRETYASIESRNGTTVKAHVSEDFKIANFPDSFEFDISEVDCDVPLYIGDSVKLTVMNESKSVQKVEPSATIQPITAKVRCMNDTFGLIDWDDGNGVIFFIGYTSGDAITTNDVVVCSLVDGNYSIDGNMYTMRAVNINLATIAANRTQLDFDLLGNTVGEQGACAHTIDEATALQNMQSVSMLDIFLETLQPFQTDDVQNNSAAVSRPNITFKDYPYQANDRDMDYNLPPVLCELINSASNVKLLAEKLHQMLPRITAKPSYTKCLHNLLFLEEIEMLNAFKYYRSERVTLSTKGKRTVTLQCGNIMELRPPISVGDFFHVLRENDKNVYLRGKVQKITEEMFTIKFKEDLPESLERHTFRVEFHYNRSLYKRKHQGIDDAVAKFSENFLFPAVFEFISPRLDVRESGGGLVIDGKATNFVSDLLNEEQKDAVVQALRGESRPLPFIIYGPPGTGKTYVLIEIIRQLFRNVPTCKLLIATQSNNAANIIAARLSGEDDDIRESMLRVVSKSVISKKKLPQELHRYSASIVKRDVADLEDEENDDTIKIELESLKKYRIIVGTCVGLGVIAQSDMNHGYFTHVLLDEAAQCIEPEAMIPISLIDPKRGQIIMAGDPLQLSPIVLSNHAKHNGLSVSMLERILELYQKNAENENQRRLVTRLCRSYRALPSILDFYSKQFYDSRLIAQIHANNGPGPQLLKSLQNGGALPQRAKAQVGAGSDLIAEPPFGVSFIDVQGNNVRMKNKKSWRNEAETEKIKEVVDILLKLGVEPEELGIITPYQAQVSSLKYHICRKSISIGTVEEFQGEERKVILYSAVKTSGKGKALQFVFCPKRLNTAVSRAKVALVVFGCSALLRQDPNWLAYITYCEENGTYVPATA